MRKYRVTIRMPNNDIQKVTITAKDAKDARIQIKDKFNVEGVAVKLRSYGELEKIKDNNKRYMTKEEAKIKARYRVKKSHAKSFVKVATDNDLKELKNNINKEMIKRSRGDNKILQQKQDEIETSETPEFKMICHKGKLLSNEDQKRLIKLMDITFQEVLNENGDDEHDL